MIDLKQGLKGGSLPDTLGVERGWGLFFLLLTACEPEPRGTPQIVIPEAKRFETEHIRQAVDLYKTEPTAEARRRMDRAFQAFDAKVEELAALAQTQTGTERALTEAQIADLQHRRGLHWDRAQAAVVETQPVRKAEPVAEKVKKAERNNRPQRTQESRASRKPQPTPMRAPLPEFVQRLFR